MKIKFRAWDKKEKKMFRVSEIIWTVKGLDINEENKLGMDLWHLEENIILLQYTGLKEKNGKEIYEGDILKTNEAGWIGEVVFDYGQFCLKDNKGGFSCQPEWRKCEAIGDIYQNKELLKY